MSYRHYSVICYDNMIYYKTIESLKKEKKVLLVNDVSRLN